MIFQSTFTSDRMRKMSDCSNFTEDEDDERSGNFGGFTSTVCVNFSEDDLRLATIPGQVKVVTVFYLSLSSLQSNVLSLSRNICFHSGHFWDFFYNFKIYFLAYHSLRVLECWSKKHFRISTLQHEGSLMRSSSPSRSSGREKNNSCQMSWRIINTGLKGTKTMRRPNVLGKQEDLKKIKLPCEQDTWRKRMGR